MEKLNIAEILKDCPKGMELDCVMYDNVTFEGIKDVGYINILIKTPNGVMELSKSGCYHVHPNAKCVIFPKGKTTWEGFQRPFKEGDIVVCEDDGKINQMFILKSQINNNRGYCYTGYDFDINEFFEAGNWHFDRLATEEEKQKLFDAIKENGYKWNPETKALEKLKVSKFDITTLMPFDKVLVRDTNEYCWHATFYSHYTGTYFYTISGLYAQCIPYEENKHLLGTKDDCDEYFKTWE